MKIHIIGGQRSVRIADVFRIKNRKQVASQKCQNSFTMRKCQAWRKRWKGDCCNVLLDS